MWDRIVDTVFYIALLGVPAIVIAQIHYLVWSKDQQ